ncbi:MAG: dual OB domain-containing protein [Dehalococcoidia bacterium]
MPVTDYDFYRDFPLDQTAEADCIMTISLGKPYEVDNYCYKFVAGIMKL